MECLNCETKYKGQYCPNCGQKSKVRRLTVLTVIKDFIDALSDSDKGFLRTVLDHSTKPGVMLNDYIYGRRQRYLSAGKYSFFLIVLFTVHFSYLEHHYSWFEKIAVVLDSFADDPLKSSLEENKETDFTNSPSVEGLAINDVNNNEASFDLDFNLFGTSVKRTATKSELVAFGKYLVPRYHKTLFEYLKFFILLWIPIFSFFSFFFFYTSPYNFAEHITINSYIYAHILLIFLLLSPFYWLSPELSMTTVLASSLASLFYIIFSYMQVFSKRSKRLVKTTLSLFASFLTYTTILSLLTAGLATWIAIKNIEHL